MRPTSPITGKYSMKLFFLCFAFAGVLAGCGQRSSPPSTKGVKATVRTDTALIAKWLPKLGALQSAWWSSTKVSIDSILSPPGNPAYRVVGFARIEKSRADELSQHYQWQQTPSDWKPALTVTNININSAEWSQNAAFTEECKPQQIPGKLLFELQQGVVYFDLEIE